MRQHAAGCRSGILLWVAMPVIIWPALAPPCHGETITTNIYPLRSNSKRAHSAHAARGPLSILDERSISSQVIQLDGQLILRELQNSGCKSDQVSTFSAFPFASSPSSPLMFCVAINKICTSGLDALHVPFIWMQQPESFHVRFRWFSFNSLEKGLKPGIDIPNVAPGLGLDPVP
ncbi:hypothetical protein M406DRAFT_102334 [Cryphonectria parasitica EP155]|uniref:Uncharacterized protein n=1 Tax=Cryphonectria parasitica (strain ATCC 38755 / EP155) TaxID=660469 RepID=A0A9P5CNF3_CRYP1|nr:uncharacterized protein M406DRAFT_102334 [Cryphonectria parasitica EP155]KAF3765093.1 hypothetical protein M406DRAFT_102334 [Cryphonectria parasitica EP155]